MAKSLGDAIKKMMKKYDIESKIEERAPLNNWESTVGKQVAKHTKPVKLKYGKLYLEVDSPTWRNQLLFQKEQLLDKINSKINNGRIREIILK